MVNQQKVRLMESKKGGTRLTDLHLSLFSPTVNFFCEEIPTHFNTLPDLPTLQI
jgi:hypothetical protein